ncbi:MAG: UPF0149 family protein [Halioglobus sp.]
MYDDAPGEVDVFDFDEFADHLLDQGVLASPSQLHGCLSGLLGAGASPDPEYGLDALGRALDIELHGELASRIMQLYTVTGSALLGEEFAFYPLLPGDDEGIAERAQSLANWCDGFMVGFAYGFAGEEQGLGPLSQEAGEILRDIAAMAEAEVVEDEDDEDAEDSFMELVEYLRVAVANIYLENSMAGQDGDFTPATNRPLH